MLTFKTYNDFFSEKPQERRASSVELGSFVFNNTTGISMNCVVSDLHFALVETQISKLSDGECVCVCVAGGRDWKNATLQVFHFFACAIRADTPNQFICKKG